MFRYEFMIIAFAVALLLGIAFPLIGGTIVYKRLSSSGDALAHSALAGVAIGLVAGISPIYVSIIACIVAFLFIGLLRTKFGKYAEIGVVVVLSASVALTGILSGYASKVNFESYLFGSILLIGYDELGIVIGIAVISVIWFILTYNRQFLSLYNPEEAEIAGIKVKVLDFVHSLLFALLIAVGAKIVGSLVVSSMVVLPTAAALLLRKGYRFTSLASVVLSLLSMALGVISSYYLDWKPGATAVGMAVVLLLCCLLYRLLATAIKRKRSFSKGK